MKFSELARRYAAAIFELATESKKVDEYFSGLSQLKKLILDEATVAAFVSSPLIRSADKEKAIHTALEGQNLSLELRSFVLLLAQKNRLELLPEVIAAYQFRLDEINQVTRGAVRSATSLDQKQKDLVEKKIQSVLNKKVIMQYSEDSALIGGLVAQVGSLTFDDSLSAHLRRIKEDLTRSVN